MMSSNASSFGLLLGNLHASTSHADVKVHSINTDGRVVLDSQINVFLNTKSKVSSFGKVAILEFVFFDL